MIKKRFNHKVFSQLDFATWAISKISFELPFELVAYIFRDIIEEDEEIVRVSKFIIENRAGVRNLFKDMHYDLEKFTRDLSTMEEENKICDNANATTDRHLDTRKKNSYLLIIKALCDIGGIKYDERGEASRIKNHLEMLGLEISDDTIRNIFKEISAVVELKRK